MHITVTAKIEGLHCWPNAPEKIAFLRNLHRHIFDVAVSVETMQSDREVEFFLLKDDLYEFLDDLPPYKDHHRLKDLMSASCEMLASSIRDYLLMRGYAVRSVLVGEDGENSAEVQVEVSKAVLHG
jgi:hypothetical protein